jgi:hypothetical protein
MKNNVFYNVLIISIILSSCLKHDAKNNKDKDFCGYDWGTHVSRIVNDLGDPILVQNFQQYGTNVTYYHYGECLEFDYNNIYWYAFIDEKLAGGGYWVISPSDDNAQEISSSSSTYKDLQKKLTQNYGTPTTTYEEIDTILNGNMLIPENSNELSDEEYISLLPFETWWNDEETFINLSLGFDEYYIVKIDIFSPFMVNLFFLELAEQLEKIVDDLLKEGAITQEE